MEYLLKSKFNFAQDQILLMTGEANIMPKMFFFP